MPFGNEVGKGFTASVGLAGVNPHYALAAVNVRDVAIKTVNLSAETRLTALIKRMLLWHTSETKKTATEIAVFSYICICAYANTIFKRLILSVSARSSNRSR